MGKIAFTFEIKEELLAQFEECCDDFGMTPEVAFAVFAKAVVKEGKIPFAITTGKKHTQDNEPPFVPAPPVERRANANGQIPSVLENVSFAEYILENGKSDQL